MLSRAVSRAEALRCSTLWTVFSAWSRSTSWCRSKRPRAGLLSQDARTGPVDQLLGDGFSRTTRHEVGVRAPTGPGSSTSSPAWRACFASSFMSRAIPSWLESRGHVLGEDRPSKRISSPGRRSGAASAVAGTPSIGRVGRHTPSAPASRIPASHGGQEARSAACARTPPWPRARGPRRARTGRGSGRGRPRRGRGRRRRRPVSTRTIVSAYRRTDPRVFRSPSSLRPEARVAVRLDHQREDLVHADRARPRSRRPDRPSTRGRGSTCSRGPGPSGKIVAPGHIRPCVPSSVMRSGIPRRVLSTASRCSSLTNSTCCRVPCAGSCWGG